MIQRILCPIDLTADSMDGLTYAFSLAERNGAELIVLHAVSLPSIWQYPYEIDVYCNRWEQVLADFKVDRLLTEGERKVRQFVCQVPRARAGRVAWKARVAVGKAADEILAAAVQEVVDLIVISRCERSWLARMLRRGIVETVSRNAPCPMLLLDGKQFVARAGGWRVPVLEGRPSY
jgi:nucleotide-binding universal stress UspA family protein